MKPGVFLSVAALVALVAVGGVLGMNKLGLLGGNLAVLPNINASASPAVTMPVSTLEPGSDAEAVFTCKITIDGISIQGMTTQQAFDVLTEANAASYADLVLNVSFNESRSSFPLAQYDLTFELNAALAEAQKAESEGKDADIIQSISVNEKMLINGLQQVADTFTVEPVDAAIIYPEKVDTSLPRNEWFPVSKEEPGSKVDMTTLTNAVLSAISTRSLSAPVVATFEEIAPAITEHSIAPVTMELIGSMTTTLTKDKNRNINVTLASGFIDGTVMVPGFEFSYNTIVGRRTAERGFKMAGVIVGGDRTEQGLGGGICQVSGTLYNAAVFADLTIIERSRHSYELAYLSRGRDATVDYGTKDLRFVNDGENPVVIVMYVDKLKVTAEIYGTPLSDGRTIGIEVKTTGTVAPPEDILYVADSTVERGTTTTVNARKGINCTVYKVWYDKDGKEIDRTVLSKDRYPAIQAKVYYNPADPDPSITPTPSPTASPTPSPTATPDAPEQTPTPEPDPTPTPEGGTD